MSEDAEPFGSLGTLSAQILGVMAVLARELVRAGAVDAPRLRRELGAFWDNELAGADLPAGDRRMIESVKKVVTAALAPEEAANGQGD
jgi:hypothetical protein